MGIYYTYSPRSALAALVDTFWLYEGEAVSHARERRLPNGAFELVINLRSEALCVYDSQDAGRLLAADRCLVSGAYVRSFVIDTLCMTSLMGVSFKPGGAAPFFSVPINELHNSHVPLAALWGAFAGELRERLLSVEDARMRLCVLEQCLLERMTWPLERSPMVSFMLDALQKPGSGVAEITEQIGYSARHASQVFSEVVGLTPKQFSRVRRFQEVLRLLEAGQQINWADLAVACGYFDQAHFIHDFRAFSGLTPGMYVDQHREFRNHIPIPN